MDKLSRLTAEQRSNFVAYLDGELSEEETQEIEKMLSQSQVARHELDALAKTWELLDILPRVRVGSAFTEKTMASLSVEKPQVESAFLGKVYDQARIVVLAAGWVCGLAAVAAAGFLLTNRGIEDPTRAIVEDYRVIKNLDRYQQIGSVEFIEQLEKDVPFHEHMKLLNP